MYGKKSSLSFCRRHWNWSMYDRYFDTPKTITCFTAAAAVEEEREKNESRRCALAWARANLKASSLTRLRWSEICGEKIRVWVSVCYGAGTWEMSRRRLWHSNFCAFWLVSNLVHRGEHERVCMEKNTYFYIIVCLFIFYFQGINYIWAHSFSFSSTSAKVRALLCCVVYFADISVVGRQRRVI